MYIYENKKTYVCMYKYGSASSPIRLQGHPTGPTMAVDTATIRQENKILILPLEIAVPTMINQREDKNLILPLKSSLSKQQLSEGA